MRARSEGLAAVFRQAAVGALLLLATPGGARAADPEPATIVVIANHADAAVLPLLRAELQSLGLRVTVVGEGESKVGPGGLTEAARRHGAVAAFRVLVAEGKVEVWLADRVTGKVLLREVLVQRGGSKSAESTVVARAVELLRVSLLELDTPHAPRGELPPPPELESVVGYPEAQSAYSLMLGASALMASETVGVATGVEGRFRWRPAERWALVAGAALSAQSVELEGPKGRAELTPHWFTLGLRFEPQRPASLTLRRAAEAGFGLLWTRTVGSGAPGYSGHTASGLNPVPYLRGDLGFAPTRHLAVMFGLAAGYGLHPHGDHGQAWVRLRLWWRAPQGLAGPFKVSARLVDQAGQVVAVTDIEPVARTYPADAWRPGEVVADAYEIRLPPGTPPGEYRPLVVVYDPASGSESGRAELDPLYLAGSPTRPPRRAPPVSSDPTRPARRRRNSRFEWADSTTRWTGAPFPGVWW